MTFPLRARLLVLAAALLALPAFAQPSANSTRVPTVTRLVKQFSELETRLATSIAARDQRAVAEILDGNFEARSSATPAVPVPRDEWIRAAIDAGGEPARIEQMAVHDFGTVAVVSFRQVDAAAKSSSSARARLIVDCWVRAGERWLLAVRYAGGAEAATDGSTRGSRATGR